MSLRAPVVVGRMTLRALLRRRGAMAILLALPLVLYASRRDATGQSVRALMFGLSWAISTVAFFAAVSAHELEPRLRLAGWRDRVLIAGRLGGLLVLGAALTSAFLLVVALDRTVHSLWMIEVDFVVTSVVAVAFGTALGAAVRRELEGSLVIFFVAGLQAVVHPYGRLAKFLPFWSSREIAPLGVDGPDTASLGGALLHASAVVALCALVLLLATPRGRRRSGAAGAAAAVPRHLRTAVDEGGAR